MIVITSPSTNSTGKTKPFYETTFSSTLQKCRKMASGKGQNWFHPYLNGGYSTYSGSCLISEFWHQSFQYDRVTRVSVADLHLKQLKPQSIRQCFFCGNGRSRQDSSMHWRKVNSDFLKCCMSWLRIQNGSRQRTHSQLRASSSNN